MYVSFYVCVERKIRERQTERAREKTERAEKERLKDRQRGRPNKLHTRIRFNSTAETSVWARTLNKNKQKSSDNSNSNSSSSSNHENVRDTFMADDSVEQQIMMHR